MDFNKELLIQKILFIKDKLDANLIAHPLFLDQINYLCSRAENLIKNVHDYNVYMSEDGKKIEFIVEGEAKNHIGVNRDLYNGSISLDGDVLNVTTSQGTLYRAEDLRKNGHEVLDGCNSELLTYYDNFMYDDKGIGLSWSSYGDSYSLTSPMEYTNLREQILTSLHKPMFFFNLPPSNPNFYSDASSRCVYRTYDNLGVIYDKTVSGITPNRQPKEFSSNICQTNTEYPERLNAIPCPIATWSAEQGEYVVNDVFSIYKDKSLDEVLAEMKENFNRGIETSKTKEYNPKMYESLLEATRYSKSK